MQNKTVLRYNSYHNIATGFYTEKSQKFKKN